MTVQKNLGTCCKLCVLIISYGNLPDILYYIFVLFCVNFSWSTRYLRNIFKKVMCVVYLQNSLYLRMSFCCFNSQKKKKSPNCIFLGFILFFKLCRCYSSCLLAFNIAEKETYIIISLLFFLLNKHF